MKRGYRQLTMTALAGILAMGPLAASAVDDSEDIIKYRQKAMTAQGGHMGAMAQIMRGKVSFTDHMAGHAAAVAATAGHVKSMFPAGSDFGVTEAKMAVWENREGFEKAADESQEAADKLVAAIASGDRAAMNEAFKAVGESCKGCHKDFREKDDD